MSSTFRIGFVGLGVMGGPMAGRLLAAGFPVTVTTRTRSRAQPVVGGGAAWADSAAETAAACDVVITMLPDTPDVEEAGTGPRGLLAGARPGTYWVDMSTIAPTAWRDLARRAGRVGVRAIDAPVSGGRAGAVTGTLSIMVGARAEDFRAVRPVLAELGTPLLIGGPGAGQVTKACNQILTAGTIALVAEALALADKSGVDPRKVRTALLGGFAGSKILESHGARMLDGDYEPGFRAVLHRKDVEIVLGEAARIGWRTPLTVAAKQVLDAVIEQGAGELDSIVIHRLYRTAAHGAAERGHTSDKEE